MLLDLVGDISVSLQQQEEIDGALWKACASSGGKLQAATIGRSESGRELLGFVAGSGPCKVSLIAGCHADEPVGPETLRLLVRTLASLHGDGEALLDDFTFCIVCHVNPDGEAVNRPWMEQWPDAIEYLKHAARELPGRDVEFAFPDRRPENRAVAAFLQKHGPFRMHASLHGMGFSDGALLLIDRRWGFRTDALQNRFRETAAAAGLTLHDHNRRGEKGFFYLGPGFSTTPEGEAMRVFFRAAGDEETASRFGESSMDFVRSLGGDPLCLVTELPLFLIGREEASPPGRPEAYLRFRRRLVPPRAAGDIEKMWQLMEDYNVRSVTLESAVRMQLQILEAGLETVR